MPPLSQATSRVYPSERNLRRSPRRLEPSLSVAESASYTNIRDALFHVWKRDRAVGEESIVLNFCSVNAGLLRRVDGTESEMA